MGKETYKVVENIHNRGGRREGERYIYRRRRRGLNGKERYKEE
jgi:hypothetical protein